MIRADFTQTVVVSGQQIYASDVSVRENLEDPITQMDFKIPIEEQPGADQIVEVNAPVSITQEAQGRARTWNGKIESVKKARENHGTVYTVRALGEANGLARLRVTKVYEGTASEIITQAVQDAAPVVSLSTAGIENDPTNVGLIISRQDTPLSAIEKVAKRTGWNFTVRDGQAFYFPPDGRVAPFSIKSAENLGRDGFAYTEDLSRVENVLKSEAYEYQTLTVSQSVDGCISSIYTAPIGSEFEVAEAPTVTSPESLKGETGEMDLFTGEIQFSEPLTGDPEETFDLVVTYTVRRLLIVSLKETSSINLYGIRESVTRPTNDGDDIDSVLAKMELEIPRRAFPLVTASCQVTDFGLSVGDWVTVDPIGSVQARSMIVTGIRHTTNGVDLQIDIDLASQSYAPADPVPELLDRIESLEKSDFDPGTVAGREIIETGESEVVNPAMTIMTLASTVDFTPVQPVDLTGGGSTTVNAYPYQIQAVSVTGGGETAVNAYPYEIQAVSVTGGGSTTVNAYPYEIQAVSVTGGGTATVVARKRGVESVSLTGGGSVSLVTLAGVNTARVTESGEPRVTSDGSARVLEAAVNEAAVSLTGGGSTKVATMVASRLTESGDLRVTQGNDTRGLE